ncbi:MAG: hypothetical protein ACLR79_13890 [Waltera sp.]|uniref:hypothetical protein n=1 Tax=Waltera sp. TaxID=2815806 RepID=UPI003992A56E
MANRGLTSKAKIVILFANQYDMKDESGNKLTGCSVHYLFWGEDGEAVASEAEFDPSKPVGVQRAKCSVESVLRNKIVVAPGLYEGTFEMTTGSDGKPVNRLRDVAFISHLEIKPKVLPGFIVQGMIQPEAPAPEAKEPGKAAK